MEKYFVVRRNNKVLFIKTSDKTMWETTLAEYSYSKNIKTGMLRADIFRSCINEILNTNYSENGFWQILSLSPKQRKELFKGEKLWK